MDGEARQDRVIIRQGTAALQVVIDHLNACDAHFIPALSTRVSITDYAEKLHRYAELIEAWSGETLVGLAAIYANQQPSGNAFLSSLSVLKTFQRRGIALQLLAKAIPYCRDANVAAISLEVDYRNEAARRFYAHHGFSVTHEAMPTLTMALALNAQP